MSTKPAADLPTATIRESATDFVVEEIPAYAPCGQGEHLFITFRKTGITTLDAVGSIAAALTVDDRAAGFAGMKDRHAVTTQTASFPFPASRDIDEALRRVAIDDIEILAAKRHNHKLKTAHLRGNRFDITLRHIDAGAVEDIERALREIASHGVPNAFGTQRFGRDGQNAARALDFMAGRSKPPRNKKKQRLLFSAFQSALFNQVLERRVQHGSHRTVMAGDLAQKHDTGGLFLVPHGGPELADAQQRAERGELSATGPMFGAKMRWPEGQVAELERSVLLEALADEGLLTRFKHLGKGTRRGLRLMATDLHWRIAVPTAQESDDPKKARNSGESGDRYLRVSFVLPKGGYATTVLSQVCRLHDPHQPTSEDRNRHQS